MRILDIEVPDAVLLVPAFMTLGVIGFFFQRLLGQIRASYIFIIMYAAFGLVGIGLYWALREPDQSIVSKPNRVGSSTERLTLECAFFLVIGVAILVLKTRSEGAVRPPSYYAFASIGVGLLAVRAIVTTGERRDILRVLAQVLALGLMVRFAFVYLNPYVYVSDPQFHWHIVQQSLERGSFAGLGPYEFYPVFHLFNVATFLLGSGVSQPSWLFPVVNSLVIIATLAVVFLIGRQLSGAQVGLLAAVLTVIGNYYFLKVQYKTNWVGISFILIAVLILFKSFQTSRTELGLWGVFWVCSGAVLLIHPVNYIVYLIFLAGSYFAIQVERGSVEPMTAVPAFSAGGLFIAYLLFIDTSLFVKLVSSTLGLGPATGSERLGLTVNIAAVDIVSRYTAELVLHSLGATAFIAVLVPGLLYCLRHRPSAKTAFVLGLGCVYLFVAIVIFSGQSGELSITRILLYVAAFTGLGGAIGIWHVVNPTTRQVRSIVLIFIICVSLLSMVSYTSNNYNGVYTDEIQHFQYTVTPSTISAHGFLWYIPKDSTVTSDRYTGQHIVGVDTRRDLMILDKFNETSDRRSFASPTWNQSRYYIINKPMLRSLASRSGPNYIQAEQTIQSNSSKIYANTELGIYSKLEQ